MNIFLKGGCDRTRALPESDTDVNILTLILFLRLFFIKRKKGMAIGA